MRCGQCGEQVPDAAHFCGQCGAPIEPAAPKSLIGQTIAGRYRLVRQVGEGGMGKVFEAEQTLGSSQRAVAVKLLRPEWSHDPSVKARFHREAETVARLEHFNTVRIYDFGATDDGTLFIVMEYLQGRTLQSVLDEQGALPPERVQHIVNQASASLDEAHRIGIVHRDLKPDNILLLDSYASQRDVVKLVDFGIAKGQPSLGSSTKLTEIGAFVGTPAYMSPEQFIGGGTSPQSDIYSLGVTTHQMLAGSLPFDAETAVQWAQAHMSAAPRTLGADHGAGPIPEAMRRAVARALSKDTGHRQATAVLFAKELAGASGSDIPIRSDSSRAFPRVSEPPRPSAPRSVPPRPSSPRGSGAASSKPKGPSGDGASAVPPGAVPSSDLASSDLASKDVPARAELPSVDASSPAASRVEASSAEASTADDPAGAPPSPEAAAASPAASGGMKTAPMTQLPDLSLFIAGARGAPNTQPMERAAEAQRAPTVRRAEPPPSERRRALTPGIVLAAIFIPLAGAAALFFFFNLRGQIAWPWQSGRDVAPPPLVAPRPTPEPASPTPSPPPDPTPTEAERPATAPPRAATPPRPPAPRPTAPAATPPSTPAPSTPTLPPTSALPPGVSLPGMAGAGGMAGVPAAGGASGQAGAATGPMPPMPSAPSLPWTLPTAGACERCVAALRGSGNYSVVSAIAENLLCEDSRARDQCEAQIIEQAPIVAERAARSGDCAAALATVAAAINVRIAPERFREVNALCLH